MRTTKRNTRAPWHCETCWRVYVFVTERIAAMA